MDVGSSVDSLARSAGGSFNPVKTPLLWPFPQASQAGDQTRWGRGNGAWSLLGPSAQYVFRDVGAAGGVMVKGYQEGFDSLTDSEKRKMTDILLYQNYPGMKQFLLWLTDR